jgi:hypothetical protein
MLIYRIAVFAKISIAAFEKHNPSGSLQFPNFFCPAGFRGCRILPAFSESSVNDLANSSGMSVLWIQRRP